MKRTLSVLHATILVAAAVACGCAGDELTSTTDDAANEKADAKRQGKGDGMDPCLAHELPAGCDLCLEKGWYEDRSCDFELIRDGVCAGPDPACPEVWITFASQGAPSVVGDLAVATPILVDYDYHRLLDDHPECIEENPYGKIGWVQMGLQINGDPSRVTYHVPVAGYSTTSYGLTEFRNVIELPEDTTSFALWFSCGGAFRDWAYDNNAGANYELTLGGTSGQATVRFPESGSPELEGSLRPDGTLLVDYDYHRLLDAHPECLRDGPHDSKIGEVQMGVKIDGSPERVTYYVPVAAMSTTGYYSIELKNEIRLPADATELSMWFSCGGTFHDMVYDNNGGADYSFGVE